MALGFKDADPAHTGFQFLEDLSTAYWYSQVLFSALELKLFSHLDQGFCSLEPLARKAKCRETELARLLRAMERTGLVTCREGNWYNTQVSCLFLVQGKPDYMGDFFLYRCYMRPQWDQLTQKVCIEKPTRITALSYEERNLRYVASTDTLVRQKSAEIVRLLESEKISGPILDIGGGAGSLVRALLKLAKNTTALVFDLPEVIGAARTLYPDKKDWEKITLVGGDFRTHVFEEKFSLVCMSNFLHAYGPMEACELLLKAITLLTPDGILVVHDYFPDRKGAVPQKGALYDLAMMLNTFNGVCHDTATIRQWLGQGGIKTIGITDLTTDTAVILAKRKGTFHPPANPWADLALELGFDAIAPISPGDVVTAPWVNAKCQFGCKGFGKNIQCPPQGMAHDKTRLLLDDYTRAFLVRGAPPGKRFHTALLALEKKAFLDGFHKAFVFGAGPCPVCPACPEEGRCLHPDLARPSMEGSGIDVYASVAAAGWSLAPVQQKGQYVTYIGLFLVE
ncbi:MAG: methyltransferase domain-containing protein [Proteobacteria bacterium]|nr:methyltransferase domain-containing protein [Desulfobacula sp.]MBU4129518.1 methyltransferase domain-containing protein [Pseudomonadota bacterium]